MLVVLDGTPAAELSAWEDLAADDPLAARSRFHRMRIATPATLPELLAGLRKKNRNNVLIIPATFCADGATMRSLYDSVEEAADAMTLHWKPGLGAK